MPRCQVFELVVVPVLGLTDRLPDVVPYAGSRLPLPLIALALFATLALPGDLAVDQCRFAVVQDQAKRGDSRSTRDEPEEGEGARQIAAPQQLAELPIVQTIVAAFLPYGVVFGCHWVLCFRPAELQVTPLGGFIRVALAGSASRRRAGPI